MGSTLSCVLLSVLKPVPVSELGLGLAFIEEYFRPRATTFLALHLKAATHGSMTRAKDSQTKPEQSWVTALLWL